MVPLEVLLSVVSLVGTSSESVMSSLPVVNGLPFSFLVTKVSPPEESAISTPNAAAAVAIPVKMIQCLPSYQVSITITSLSPTWS